MICVGFTNYPRPNNIKSIATINAAKILQASPSRQGMTHLLQ
jgi:hypothetical protein